MHLNKLKLYRAMHHLTQEQLADKVNVNRQIIGLIEKEKYSPPDDLKIKIAEVFGLEKNELFLTFEN